MRSPSIKDTTSESMDDCDDIFGPPRTYPTGYCPPKNRPSMISTKYKQKEERRKVLKISLSKIKKIEDPEASLCRSVLINNTMRRLQKETRDEKRQKQQVNYPRCYDNDNYLNLKTEFLKNEKSFDEVTSSYDCVEKIVDVVVENDFDAKLAEEINKVSAKNIDVLDSLVVDDNTPNNYSVKSESDSSRMSSRKRSFDEMDDCDVQEVLSQFYMPPTPRMLTGIDDDEDVIVVDEDQISKKFKESDPTELHQRLCVSSVFETVNSFVTNNNNNHSISSTRYECQSVECNYSEANNAFSCGHASMFNEIQSNVYQSLITSLET